MQTKSPQLHSGRLILKPLSPQDAESAMDILVHPDVGKTYMLPEYSSREETRSLFERLLRLSALETCFLYGIYLQEKLIGWINETEVSGSTVEIGYVIHPSFQHHGYATEALHCAIPELFRMGYDCVRAGHFQENPASGRVMVKCGMQRTGQSEMITYRSQVHPCLIYEIHRK